MRAPERPKSFMSKKFIAVLRMKPTSRRIGIQRGKTPARILAMLNTMAPRILVSAPQRMSTMVAGGSTAATCGAALTSDGRIAE